MWKSSSWPTISPARKVLFGVVVSAIAILIIAFFLDRSLPESSWSQRGATIAPRADSSAPTSPAPTTPSSTVAPAPATTSPAPATGSDLYGRHCASCHGAALEGGVGPELDRGSDASELSDGRFELRIVEGKDDMPAFGSVLTPEQVDLIVRYVRDQQSG